MQRSRWIGAHVCTAAPGTKRGETHLKIGPVNGSKGRPLRARFQIRARLPKKGPARMAGGDGQGRND